MGGWLNGMAGFNDVVGSNDGDMVQWVTWFNRWK